MAFRKKGNHILSENPDVIVVPECEHPEKISFDNETITPSSSLWFGDNQNKGLGIFSYNTHQLRLMECYNPGIKYVVPVTVSSKKNNFTLFAIWANNPNDPAGRYIGQVWKAITCYENLLKSKRVILIGDFNSNSIWDKEHGANSHSNMVKSLESKNIFSCYHHYYRQAQGKEKHPTLYMYRHEEKKYHIDYCFTSMDLIKKISSVQVGEYTTWAKFSDHVPLIITFDTW